MDDLSPGTQLTRSLGYEDLAARIEGLTPKPQDERDREYEAILLEARDRYHHGRLLALRPDSAVDREAREKTKSPLSDLSGPAVGEDIKRQVNEVHAVVSASHTAGRA